MAHIRNRFVYNNLVKTLKYSPLVGVLGHRQVGKTTLVRYLRFMLQLITIGYWRLMG